MRPESTKLVRKITGNRRGKAPASSTTSSGLRRESGVIVSVSGSTATVTLANGNVAGVPFHRHVTSLTAGDKVDVVFDGDTPMIWGAYP